MLAEKSPNYWLSIYVHGLEDSLVEFGLNEHKFNVNGDNSYLIILKAGDEDFLYHKVTNSNKLLK